MDVHIGVVAYPSAAILTGEVYSGIPAAKPAATIAHFLILVKHSANLMIARHSSDVIWRSVLDSGSQTRINLGWLFVLDARL
jgi:hypothetical protein